jgi:hypothetical protein
VTSRDTRRILRAGLILAALGATLGTLLDGIHSHFGATAYTHPVAWRAAWWVPLLFAGAYTIGLVRPLLERRFHVRSPLPTWPAVTLAFGLFIGAYWLSVLPASGPVVAAVLAGVFLLAWSLCDRSHLGLAIALAAAAGGPAVEALLVSRGVFVHLHTFAFGVPAWLPFLYMTASVALCALARRLVDR